MFARTHKTRWCGDRQSTIYRTSPVTAGLLLLLMLIANHGFAGGLLVSWDPNREEDLAGYRLYYGTSPSNYTQVIDVGNTTTYDLDGLLEGETYYLALTAYDKAGNESIRSAEVSATIAPVDITIAVANNQIEINWSDMAGADSYSVYASSDPYFSPQTPIASLNNNRYTTTFNPRSSSFSRYYVVEALSAGQRVHTFDRVGVFNKALRRGQNLVSTPLIPSNTQITKVLGSQLTGAVSSNLADNVLYWNGVDYEISWLVEGSGSALDGKWVTQAGDKESSLLIDPDHSFWVIIRSTSVDTILTFAGKVSSDPNRTITLVKGPNYIGTCYPVSVSLTESDLASDEVTMGSNSASTADKVMHWLGTAYDVAWLVDGTGTSWDGFWLNESGAAPSSIQFTPGTGYILWIKGDNPSQVWTYPNPQYKL